MITDEDFIKICKASKSMKAAAEKLKYTSFSNFKRRAITLKCYIVNQSGKGTKRPGLYKIDIDEILNGLHPTYQTFKLKQRLYAQGYKINKCEICGIDEWLGKTIECELDHINGISNDHRLVNLRILCPNCHSQTHTFRAKNIKKK